MLRKTPYTPPTSPIPGIVPEPVRVQPPPDPAADENRWTDEGGSVEPRRRTSPARAGKGALRSRSGAPMR